MAGSGAEGTDEAALAEQIGSTVLLVPGDPRNIKITTTADLAFARGLLLERGEPVSHRKICASEFSVSGEILCVLCGGARGRACIE